MVTIIVSDGAVRLLSEHGVFLSGVCISFTKVTLELASVALVHRNWVSCSATRVFTAKQMPALK